MTPKQINRKLKKLKIRHRHIAEACDVDVSMVTKVINGDAVSAHVQEEVAKRIGLTRSEVFSKPK